METISLFLSWMKLLWLSELRGVLTFHPCYHFDVRTCWLVLRGHSITAARLCSLKAESIIAQPGFNSVLTSHIKTVRNKSIWSRRAINFTGTSSPGRPVLIPSPRALSIHPHCTGQDKTHRKCSYSLKPRNETASSSLDEGESSNGSWCVRTGVSQWPS